MKIDIVYTTKSKYIKCVADEMARWVKTYAQDLNHYHSDHDVDLLVIGFDDTLFKDKQLLEFIQSLSRQNVKNLALINCFFINNKRLMKVIHLCQNIENLYRQNIFLYYSNNIFQTSRLWFAN